MTIILYISRGRDLYRPELLRRIVLNAKRRPHLFKKVSLRVDEIIPTFYRPTRGIKYNEPSADVGRHGEREEGAVLIFCGFS